jgi:2-desacetyl-2-hydroxyethyl bacteriochlorophyllide A dehydrogenase
MKAVVCSQPGHLTLTDRPDPPVVEPGSTLVEIAHVGICGTDYHIFEGKHPFLAYPRVMGHEVSARVVEAGAGSALSPGTPVIVNPYVSCGVCGACRKGKPNCCVRIKVLGVHTDGAMCERIVVPSENLYPAEGISLEQAATVEFLAIGAHGVRRSMAGTGARALVVGAGPIGLGAALFARIAGQTVTLLDGSAERLAFARDELGFAATLALGPDLPTRIADMTDGEGFDVVYDATGNAGSMQAVFAHVAHGGALVLLSVVKDDIVFSDPEFHKREMMVIGSRNAQRIDFEHVVRSISNGSVPVDALITHRTTLDRVPADLARWAHDKTGLVKAVIAVADAG